MAGTTIIGIVVTMMLTAAAGAMAAGESPVPKVVREVCAACHGMDGNGSQPLHAEYPKLAAKQSAYLKKQLNDYRTGKRKSLIMTGFAANLTPEQIDEVSAYFAGQSSKPSGVNNSALLPLGRKIFLDGNVDSGVPACAGCHLEDASGNVRYPHLAGQHAPYTYGELRKFANGERDNDRGLVMQSVMLRMTEEEMKAVAEYIASLK
jgi:cytochrome c553